MRIRRLPRAILDVDEIWSYVAAHDLTTADRLVQRIADATNRLTDHPTSAPARPDLGEGVRTLVVGSYLVLYLVGPDSVDVIRVVHGARDLERLRGSGPD